jgi:hypothetical protein
MKRTFIVRHGDKCYECTRIALVEKPGFVGTVGKIFRATKKCVKTLSGANRIRKGYNFYNYQKANVTFNIRNRGAGFLVLDGLSHLPRARRLRKTPVRLKSISDDAINKISKK